MKKNDLLCSDKSVLRVLAIKDNSVLIVDCVHKSAPRWISSDSLKHYSPCTAQNLYSVTNECIPRYDDLSANDRKTAHERFTMVAPILAVVEDDSKRCSMIAFIAEEHGISKQTIRSFLWRYLVYQDISALAPKQRRKDKPLTQDEKNMRWALNKFFYTRHKNCLTTTYTMMLKEKYCDGTGNLLPRYPTINQFRYFYKKYNKMETYYISREGLKSYQRNYRPLLGDGIHEFAPNIGVAMLDATICDIYLVDNCGNLIGRPILTACVDAYSGLCCGYFLSWEGGFYSLRGLMLNVVTNKAEWSNQFGISIEQKDWDCQELPAVLVTDMGSEYISGNFEQLAELGTKIINLPPYRPELKGVVEKFFDLIQTSFKPYLKGKGVIEPDFQERGAKDYRKDACLTMQDFEKIILHCIIFYNNKRIIEHFPFTTEMLSDAVQPFASNIWNWGKLQSSANLISVDYDTLILTLLPRTTGRFSRTGLIANGLRYKNDAFTERYLLGGTATVSYNPDDVSCIWLFENGIYERFTLVESRFWGENQSRVESILEEQKSRKKPLQHNLTQAKIDLANHIEAIASSAMTHNDTNVKQIRHTRRKEQIKTHRDFVKGDA